MQSPAVSPLGFMLSSMILLAPQKVRNNLVNLIFHLLSLTPGLTILIKRMPTPLDAMDNNLPPLLNPLRQLLRLPRKHVILTRHETYTARKPFHIRIHWRHPRVFQHPLAHIPSQITIPHIALPLRISPPLNRNNRHLLPGLMRRIHNRIKLHKIPKSPRWEIIRRNAGSNVPSRTEPTDRYAGFVEPRRLRKDPVHDADHVVDGAGEGVLGRDPIVDVYYHVRGFGGDGVAVWIVEAEAWDYEAGAAGCYEDGGGG